MVRLACPRCHHIIDADPAGQPTCPNCGFTGAVGETPPPAGFRVGQRGPERMDREPWTPAPAAAPPASAAPGGSGYGAPPYGAAPPSSYGTSPYGSSPYTTPGPDPYARPTVLPYGGFWIRVVSWLLDALIVGVPVAILVSVLFPGTLSADPEQPIDWTDGISVLASWLYHAFMQSGPHQATLGKMAVGLKVTDLNGQRISFARATGRYFATILSAVILLIGHFMIGWTQRKQGLHDMIAGTLVYKKDHVPRSEPAPPAPAPFG